MNIRDTRWSRAAPIYLIVLLVFTRWSSTTGLENISADKMHDSVDDHCGRLDCGPNSACRVTFHSGIATAECVCPQGWVGDRCQARLKISVVTVTMTTVSLRLNAILPVHNNVMDRDTTSFRTSAHATSAATTKSLHVLRQTLNYSERVRPELMQLVTYSIHYWAENQSSLCNIVPTLSQPDVTVSGLVANTQYIFCAKTSPHDWCDFDLVNAYTDRRLPTPCVNVTTAQTEVKPEIAPEEPAGISIQVVVAVVVAVVALIVLIVIVVFAIRKGYFMRMMFAKKRTKSRKPNHNATNGGAYVDTTIEMLLLNSPTTNQRITICPPTSPGKPKHHLVHNTKRGYASFTAMNEQTIALSTVMEYGSQDDVAMPEANDGEEEHLHEENQEATESENESFDADHERLREILS